MKKVAFICRGNMHRSPTAAALYNHLKKDDSYAYSYGTMVEAEGRSGVVLSSYPDFAPLIEFLKSNYNIDISGHVCTQITPEHLRTTDKIIMIAKEDTIPPWLKKYNYDRWNIADDFSTPEILEKDIETIRRKVETLF